jgi:hypothetical protein
MSAEGIVIAPVNKNADIPRFKAEVMAQVRSIEQQYWSLTQQHVQLWASEKAVEMGEEILKREQAELEVSRGTVADVTEATQRLEQFKLDLVTKNSDVMTTERQLRKLLGLPSIDDRMIVPVTPGIEAKVSPDWNACLAEMLEKQPDIVQSKDLVKKAEGWVVAAAASADVATMFLPELAKLGPAVPPSAKARETADTLARQKEFLQQVQHQSTHSLARFFLEIDANYKQFQTAKRYRASARQRLEAQRAFYNEGRITIDRYLDAVSQFASSVGQEAQFKASYNTALVALEEAKGTLLEFDNITVAEPSKVAKSKGHARDDQTRTASFEEPAPASGSPVKEKAPCECEAAGKTVSFQMTVGVGSKPVEIRGTFTVGPVKAAKGEAEGLLAHP